MEKASNTSTLSTSTTSVISEYSEDGSDLLERAKTLANLLSTFEKSLGVVLNGEIEAEDSPTRDAVQNILQVSLCRLVKLLVPNVQRKIDEIIIASEMNMTVSKSEHGADMTDDDDNRFELKVSLCTKGKMPSTYFKSNFNWPLPTGSDARERLLKQVEEKTGGKKGGVIFVAKTKTGIELNKYLFSGRFMLKYFQHLPLTDSGIHNFGSARCVKCEKYHRLERMLMWDKEDREIENEECDIYKSVASQCK